MVRPDLTRHKRKREFEIRNVQKEKKSWKKIGYVATCAQGENCVFTVGVSEWVTYSVVDGDERSVAMLPCLLSCCSLGEDGSESVISSISSWADWDLVFFLLNACLKELRNCKVGQKKQKQKQTAWVNITGLYRNGEIW